MFLLLVGCVPPPPIAPPPAPLIEGAQVEWFDLEGVDRIDLLESCLRDCPRDEAGTAVASLTSWRVDWSWVRDGTDACGVAGANVDASVTVELPRWAAPPEADPALVAEWDAWFRALRRHEQGHVDVVHTFAHDAERVIADAGCAGADEAGARILDGLGRAQHDYDAQTASGHRQGASFWAVAGRSQNRGELLTAP
ncbi:MAG: DUF922 domain-containing protein [Myxococcota bacterium]